MLAEKNPPIIKQIVATKEGHCKVESPMMECPLVHPPAYLVPNPTKNPPKTKNANPFNVKIFATLKIWVGISLLKSVIPYW